MRPTSCVCNHYTNSEIIIFIATVTWAIVTLQPSHGRRSTVSAPLGRRSTVSPPLGGRSTGSAPLGRRSTVQTDTIQVFLAADWILFLFLLSLVENSARLTWVGRKSSATYTKILHTLIGISVCSIFVCPDNGVAVRVSDFQRAHRC